MVQPITKSPLGDVGREARAENRSRRPLHEPQSTPPASPMVSAPDLAMPDFVTHNERPAEIGNLSAEAVVREFEAAAKEIELMRGELVERARQCEAMTRDALAVVEDLNEVAARYREEAKRTFEQIEGGSSILADAHKISTSFRDKIAGRNGT